jgi:hypothetical protein
MTPAHPPFDLYNENLCHGPLQFSKTDTHKSCVPLSRKCINCTPRRLLHVYQLRPELSTAWLRKCICCFPRCLLHVCPNNLYPSRRHGKELRCEGQIPHTPAPEDWDKTHNAADRYRTKVPWTWFHTTTFRVVLRNLGTQLLHLNIDRRTQLLPWPSTASEETDIQRVSKNWTMKVTGKSQSRRTGFNPRPSIWVYGGQKWSWEDLSPRDSAFHCQYYHTNPPYSNFILPTSTMRNRSSWQCL